MPEPRLQWRRSLCGQQGRDLVKAPVEGGAPEPGAVRGPGIAAAAAAAASGLSLT